MHPPPPTSASPSSSWVWRLLDRAGDLATRVLGDEHDHVLRPRSDLLASETVPDDHHRDVAVAVAPGGEPAITVAQHYIVQGNNAQPSAHDSTPAAAPATGQGQHTGVAAFADYDRPVVVVNRLALVGNALGLFAPTNPVRQAAVRIVASRHWKLVMVTLTALHWLLLALRPWSKGEASQFTLLSAPLELALLPIFAIYNLEIILKLIAYGALLLPPAFRKSSLFVDTDEVEVIDDSRRVDDDADDSERADEALETVAKAMHIEPYGKEEVVSLERLNEEVEDRDEESADTKSVKEALQVANDVIRSRSPARSPGLLHVPLTDHDAIGHRHHSPARSHSHSHTRRDSTASATSTSTSTSVSAPTLDPYLIPKPFLHTTANQYDLIAVLAFWLYVILGLSSVLTPLWILRGLTASRPFRLLGLTRGTRMIMASFRASRRLLRNVAVFTGFFFLLLVIAGVFSLKGAFQRQCMVLSEDAASVSNPVAIRHCGGWVTQDGWNAEPMDPWAEGERVPNATRAERVTGYQCPYPQICMTSQPNPWFNFASFDHLPSAALVQYSVMTGENWGPILHGAMDADSPAAAFYFILTVIVLGFLVLQLFIAVMCESFSSVRGAYLDAKAIAADEKKRRKREERACERAERESMISRQTGMSPGMRRAVDVVGKIQESIVWQAAFFVCLAMYTWIVSQVASMETTAGREAELGKWFWVEIVFTLVFAIELGMRVVTTGWRKTLKEHPSDSIMAAVTLVLLVVPFNKYLTAFQVFRTYKLVTYIPPVKALVVATKGVTDMVSVVLFMTMAMAAAATYGMQMFGGVYESPSNNWVTFDNIGSAWLALFSGFLIGDNWTEYLWACMKAHADALPVLGPIIGAAFVVITYSALNFIVLNLLIVVVLDVFDEDDDEKRAKQVEMVEKREKEEEEEGGRGPGKQQVVDKWWGRLQSWASTKGNGALDRLAQEAENGSTPPASREGTVQRRAHRADPAARAGADAGESNGDLGTMAASTSWNNDDRPLLGTVESQSQRLMQSQTSVMTESSASELYLRRQEPKFTSLAEVVAAPKAVKDSPSFSLTQLMPRRIDGLSADFEQDEETAGDKTKKRKNEQRQHAKSTLRRLVESRWFTIGIFLTVLFSIVTALLDTPVYRLQRLREFGGVSQGTNFADPFVIFDLVACVIFGFEFLCKLAAYRLDFFRDGWNLLDLLVLLTMVFSYAADEATASVMRMSRALRPLKTIVYLPGVQSVFAALVVGLPRIISAVAFSMLILFPYSLYGMFLFSGELMRCTDTSVNSRDECTGVYLSEQGLLMPRVWDNVYRAYNFDSIGKALTLLFTMASSEGWTDMMKLTMAIRGEGLQPAPSPAEAPTLSWWHCVYSVSFMFVASVFTLNLFIGIVIRSFDETSGDAFLTPAQKAWNTACKRIAGLRPRALYRPAKRRSAPADLVGRFLTSYGKPFNLFVTGTMVLHVALMCVEHAGQPLAFTRGRDIAFQVFVVLFFVQTMLLMTTKGPIYFFRKSIWNLYEFVVNSLGFIFVIVQLFVDDDTFTQLQKLLLVAYALRLARRVNGLHTLFKTMRASASDLLRVFFVLAIILLFFSLVGTELFGLTRFGNAFVDNGSVRNTWISLLLQFRLLTGDDWPNIMQDLLVDGSSCVKGNGYLQSDCGSPIAAYIFFVSFFIVCTYVLLNLIIALLVNNFDYCFSTNHTIISDDGLRSFQLAWSTLDPRGSGKIRRAQIASLLARSTLQKVDYQLAQDRRWRSNILFYDLLAQCKDDYLNFQTALMTLCLHVIPLQECLTYDQYKYRVEYLRRLSQHIARERLEGLFLMAVARRRFTRQFRQVVQEAVQQSRLNAQSVASSNSAAGAITPPNGV